MDDQEDGSVTSSESSGDEGSSIHESITSQKESHFRPLNFPTSPEFTPPPRVRTPLPGIVPERPAPFETAAHNYKMTNCEEEDDDKEVKDSEPGITWIHVLFSLAAVLASIMAAIYTMSRYPSLESSFASKISASTFKIESQVNNKLFGQPEAVSKVLDNLIEMTKTPKTQSWCRVLLFTGGPGVGKDYLSQIVKKHFYSKGGSDCKENSYLSYSSKKLICKRKDFNVVSFETIFSQDSSQIDKSANVLATLINECAASKDRSVFIVPVLVVKAYSIPSINEKGVDSFSNSQDYWQYIKSEGRKVKSKFEKLKIPSELVFFRPLSWSDVKLCILESAKRQGKAELSQDEIDDVLNSLLTSAGPVQDFVAVGCKDVDPLVAMLPSPNKLFKSDL